MPKETFFNLPDEKRERITAVALEEFGENEYGDVSISRMVAKAGIAKGSFYQYFEDKEDLYVYLLDLLVEKKKEMLSLDHPDPEHIGLFRYLHWIVQAGLRLDLAYPELRRLAYRAMNQTGYPKKFAVHAQQESRLFYRRLVARGKEEGDIAPEVDDELAAFIFDLIFTGVGQFLLERIDLTDSAAKEPRAIFDKPEIARIFDQTVDILEHGMGVCHSVQASAAEAVQGNLEVSA